MRSDIAFIVLLGVAISSVTLVSLKGGKSMFMQHKDAEAVTALPPAGARHSGTFETATFALG
jgi:hypothetical protein